MDVSKPSGMPLSWPVFCLVLETASHVTRSQTASLTFSGHETTCVVVVVTMSVTRCRQFGLLVDAR